jgi:hypothetical protein
MQTEIAVKKIFLWGENNRSKLSRFRNKFIQSAHVYMNEAAFADIMTRMELALTVAKPRSGAKRPPQERRVTTTGFGLPNSRSERCPSLQQRFSTPCWFS